MRRGQPSAHSRPAAASCTLEEITAECFGRNTDVPSARWNTAGLDASSGVSRVDGRSAASTTSPSDGSRSARHFAIRSAAVAYTG